MSSSAAAETPSARAGAVRPRSATAFALATLVACAVRAQPAPPPAAPSAPSAEPPRPRIGLALSGGGARGFAHVGVLRVLESLRVPVDCIAGTSAGSAVGAAYASGLSPDEIERQLRSVDWERDMFDDAPPRREQQPRRKNEEKAYLLDLTVGLRDGSVVMPPGLISGQKIELFLHRLLGSSALLDSFDRLPIPFRAIATDLERGEMVVQDRGSLPTAVRASMAVPSVFSPVSTGGRLLVDGGLTRNMPVDVVRAMCADVVIAVDIGSPLLRRDELGSAFGVAGQMVGILMERNMRDSRAEIRPGRDVMIHPDLGDIGAASFARGVDGIPAGEGAARAAQADLERLALPPDAYDAWRAARAARVVRDDRYAGVRVAGTDPGTGRAMLAQAGLRARGELDRGRLEQAIHRWNSTGDYDRIGYALRPDGAGGQVLELDVVERGWGPNFMRFGLGASADSQSNGVFNVLVGFRRPRFNAFGGEFKTELQFGSATRWTAELFQPVNRGDARFFVSPQLLWEDVPVWLFVRRDRFAEYSVRTRQAAFDVGVEGRYGEARLGVLAGTRDAERSTGSPLLPGLREDFVGLQAAVVADQLDATDFPRDGWMVGASWRGERTDSGTESGDTHRTQLFGKHVASRGDHTVAVSYRLGEARGPVSPAVAFSLGGFMNVSGLQPNQVLGTSLRYASIGYQNQLLTLPNPIGRGVYGGLALEAGRMGGTVLGLDANEWIPGATAYVGAHTGIGPVYLGYGAARGGNRLVYLFLGRPGL